jgi:hypothetical protein
MGLQIPKRRSVQDTAASDGLEYVTYTIYCN